LGSDIMLVKLFFVWCLAATVVKANRRDHRGGMNRYRLEGLEETQTSVNDTKIVMIVNNTLVSSGDNPVRGPPVTRTRSTTTTTDVPKTVPSTTPTSSPDDYDDTPTPSIKEGSVPGISFCYFAGSGSNPVGEA